MAMGQIGAVLHHLQKLVGTAAGEDQTDAQLVERFLARREESAFEILVRRHGGLVLRVCQRVLNDSHAAEDAFQATFLVLARKASSIRRHESLGSWLYGVAYRVARKARVNVGRRQLLEKPLDEVPESLRGDEQSCVETRQVLDEELVRLADRFRAPLILCYLEGKTYGQAARELGWSEGSMSRRLAQARERLRHRLIRRGITLSSAGLGAALVPSANAVVPASLIDAALGAAAPLFPALGAAAGGLSASATTLAHGVLREMAMLKLKIAASLCLAVGLVATTVGLAAHKHRSTHHGDSPQVAQVGCPDPSPIRYEPYEVGAIENCPEDEMGNLIEPAKGLDEMEPVRRPDYDELESLMEPPPTPKIKLKRRDRATEDEMRQLLLKMPELNLEQNQSRPITQEIIKREKKPMEDQGVHYALDLFAHRQDLAGLPMLKGKSCEVEKERIDTLAHLSREMRRMIGEVTDNIGANNPNTLAGALRINFVKGGRIDDDNGFKVKFARANAIPTLMQMLTAEGQPVRRVLVEQLARLDDPAATQALAKLALFDISPDVRAAAVEALIPRPKSDYRALLLEGFRYPWAPVADHAAEALVALEDSEAVPALKQLAERPDLSGAGVDPKDKTPYVREVVRINHLRNCFLCHASGGMQTRAGNGFGPVPDPEKPLPPPGQYYSPNGEKVILVRADITYLRQDFSVAQAVEKADPWPTMQRYDFLVRQRPATNEPTPNRAANSQREAVLFALKELEQK